MRWSAQIHTKFHVHCITQEIPRRAPVFGYGLVTLYEAIFHSLHLTFALPRRAPTTPGSFLRSVLSFDHHSWERSDLPRLRRGLIEAQVPKRMNEPGLACSAFARHY